MLSESVVGRIVLMIRLPSRRNLSQVTLNAKISSDVSYSSYFFTLTLVLILLSHVTEPLKLFNPEKILLFLLTPDKVSPGLREPNVVIVL